MSLRIITTRYGSFICTRQSYYSEYPSIMANEKPNYMMPQQRKQLNEQKNWINKRFSALHSGDNIDA